MGADDDRSDRADQPVVRASDADRQAVVVQLQRHFADGRLTLDEFVERTGDAYAARARADLDPLLADLPAVPLPSAPAPDAPVRQGRGRQLVVAIMSGARRRGRWRVDRPITAVAFWGAVKLDLRDAEVLVDRVRIRAWAVMGAVEVVVPEGVPVDVDGFVLMGGNEDRTRPAPSMAGVPVVEVRAHGLWGGVKVRNPRSGGARDAARAARDEDRARRHQDRAARHADRDRHRAHRSRRTGPSGPPAALPMPSLEGMLPTLPEPAEAVLRDLGLIGAVAADPAADPAPVPGAGPRAAGGQGEAGAPQEPVGRPTGTVTILFTDIAGSTELAIRLGDHRWVDVLQAHNTLVRSQVATYGGTEVKVHGDGFMVAFASARSAVRAAIDIQRELAALRAWQSDAPVEVRIGIHTGEVVDADGDYFGRNVILAARIADRAQGGEILVSSLVKELTDSTGDLRFDDGEEVELKGLVRPWRVHRVEWR